MPQLTAVGAEPSQRRQVDIAAQRTLRLGRTQAAVGTFPGSRGYRANMPT